MGVSYDGNVQRWGLRVVNLGDDADALGASLCRLGGRMIWH